MTLTIIWFRSFYSESGLGDIAFFASAMGYTAIHYFDILKEFWLFSSCPVIRFAKDFIKNPNRPLPVNSTPCGYCPEQKIGEKFDFRYFRT
ncbi:hypothetical protein KKD49_07125, partial [Myxococcota bacterium]|nr:hypothetical protein [Myxococcota bacterium]